MSKQKVALITGITGQDGSYLAEFLLEKGYVIHGIKRRASSFNTERIDHLYQDPHVNHPDLILHYGDLTDTSNLVRIIQECQPDEIYNLGAQSHVAVSFESPEYTADVDAMGPLRMLEAIRILGLEKKTRFYQASTSELYGLVQEIPQKETTPFYPRSPYAVAKLYAYWITVNYREAYGMYACNGILFNHESKRRGETFVTRKVTRGLANIAQGLEKCLYMGNIDALRDWGHAKDYVRMQWLMLQQDKPEDFVIATGVQFTVREFIILSAQQLGITLKFAGVAENEKAIVAAIEGDKAPALKVGDVIVQIDPRYYRPTEVETLLGDPTKAKEKLGWVPEIALDQMIVEMVAHDLNKARQHALLNQHGYAIAKIAGIKLCESYNRQYGQSHGLDYRSVMPTNLYGPGDNYHPENSHVIPALIRRFHEAKTSNTPEVVIWGTGTPRREFLYVDDMASASVFVMNLEKNIYDQQVEPMQSHINVGFGDDVTIQELTGLIAKVVGYKGNIVFDTTKPDGAPRKWMDSSKLSRLGWNASTDLDVGLKTTYQEFLRLP